MLDAKAFANAATLVSLALYFICVLLVAVAPDLLYGYFSLTTHGLAITSLRPQGTGLNIANVLIGALLWGGTTWLTFYAGAYLYNSLKK